jgi:2-oxoglutarate ferredoxin oxidoreductase subunit alpha
MLGLIRQELSGAQISKLRSVLHYNGLPMDARSMTDDVLAKEGNALVSHEHELAEAHENATGGVGGE